MLIVNNHPWHVGVRWVQGFSLLSHLNEVVHSFLACGTLADGVPVEVVGLGAFLPVDVPVVGAGFETDDEGQSLGVQVVFLNSAGLNQVTLAFCRTMLASE